MSGRPPQGPAERLYAAALRLHPRPFRERFGGAMRQLYADRCRDARRRGGAPALVRYAAGACLSEAAGGLAHRFAARERRASRRPGAGGAIVGFLTDVEQAARSLAREPGFTAVAVLTLSLGIGAGTAVFTAVNAVLLRPLPYPAAERLMMVWHHFGEGAQSLPAVSARDYLDYRAEARVFEDFAAGSGGRLVGVHGVLGGEGEPPELVRVAAVDAHFFPLLGVEPALGRGFRASETDPGGEDVALLSHELFERRYGGDRRLVGGSVPLDGRRFRVVGVLPPGFELLLPREAFMLEDSDVWVPLKYDYAEAPARNYTSLTVIGRLAEGRTFAEGRAEVEAVAARLRERHPVHRDSGLRAEAVPLHRDVTKGAAPALLTLLGAVALVLLVACANAAHLLLARGAGRRREIAMRAALGAGRGRIVRRLLAESALIAVAAAAGGLLLAGISLRAVIALRPAGLPRLDEIALDPAALAFALAAAAVAVLLAGLVPAMDAARADLSPLLRQGQGATADPRARRLRGGLVVAELAVTLVLLVGAGLLLRSFAALQDVKPGYDPDRTLTFRIALPEATYPDVDHLVAMRRRLEADLLALPGVEAVGTTSQLPLAGTGALQPYAFDEDTARNWESVTADGRWISPGYFEAMGTRLLAGRGFTEADIAAVPAVVVIDPVVAERAFGGGQAVGRKLQVAPDGSPDRFATVIGVAEHQRLHDLARRGLGQIWRPGGWRRISFALRVVSDPANLTGPVRRTVAEADPELPVSALRPMSDYVDDELESARFTLLLMTGFGVVALLLAAVGAAGVMARAVALRRREIGIRLALGASPLRVRRQLVGEGARSLAVALALGLLTASAVGPRLSGLLYGVSPRDLATYAAVSGVLAAVALLACWLPARRASGVDPAVTLRES